jgi:hypothetical protein
MIFSPSPSTECNSPWPLAAGLVPSPARLDTEPAVYHQVLLISLPPPPPYNVGGVLSLQPSDQLCARLRRTSRVPSLALSSLRVARPRAARAPRAAPRQALYQFPAMAEQVERVIGLVLVNGRHHCLQLRENGNPSTCGSVCSVASDRAKVQLNLCPLLLNTKQKSSLACTT